MIIYTSYYGNLKKLNNSSIITIGISVGIPKFYQGFVMKELAPRYDMLKLPELSYREEFAKILDSRDPKMILEKIKAYANGKDVALLCYEKPGEFCHRQLVAAWLLKETGVMITEYL
jgi:hypothetical protein